MALPKTAVDKTTEQYYADYFGEYGKLLTRSIPRSIKAALDKAYRRTAGKNEAAPRVSQLIPLGYVVKDDNTLHLDGIARVGKIAQLFHAEFKPDGTMLRIATRRAPTV